MFKVRETNPALIQSAQKNGPNTPLHHLWVFVCKRALTCTTFHPNVTRSQSTSAFTRDFIAGVLNYCPENILQNHCLHPFVSSKNGTYIEVSITGYHTTFQFWIKWDISVVTVLQTLSCFDAVSHLPPTF